jgi:hypothetical protein
MQLLLYNWVIARPEEEDRHLNIQQHVHATPLKSYCLPSYTQEVVIDSRCAKQLSSELVIETGGGVCSEDLIYGINMANIL